MQFHLLEVPTEYGVLGLDYITIASIYEEMTKADAGIPSTLATTHLL